MPATIASSVIVSTGVQKDGRIWVQEVHTDTLGTQYQHIYLALATDNQNANLAAYAVQLLANLVAAEIAQDLYLIETQGSNAVVTTVYCTLDQIMQQARPLFAIVTGVIAVNLGDWFNMRSFVELQNAFGFINVSQYNTFKAQWFTPNANLATSVRTATGA